MSKARLVIGAFIVCSVGLAPVAVIAQQGGTQPQPRVLKRQPSAFMPDRSLGERLQTIDAVVTARVLRRVGVRMIDLRDGIFRRNPEGVVTIDEETHVPQLIEGRQYLFLLNFSHDVNEMQFSEYDVFDISEAKVVANERLRQKRFGKELEGLSTQQALHNIRILLEKP